MQIETIVVGEFAVNCLVCAGTDSQAIVIDPGADAELVIAHLRERNLNVALYLLTHGHCDHISGLAKMHAAFPAPVAIHPADGRWAFSEANVLPPFYSATPTNPSAEVVDLAEEQAYTVAGIPFTVIETPGHTPGGVCIYMKEEEILITGDTLFAGSVGRTDLPAGDSRQLAASLKKLKALPDQTHIIPGHGQESTMGQEKRTNYFMKG